MKQTICTKYSGNKFWDNVLFKIPNKCTLQAVTLPFNDPLINDSVLGCLEGTATPMEDGLILTYPVSNTYGIVNYTFSEFQPIISASFSFEISLPSSGDGADGTYFYFNASEIPLTEDAQIEGYVVGFSEYHGLITIKYGTDFFDLVEFEFDDDIIYNITFTFDNGAYHIYIDDGLALQGLDTNYDTRTQIGHTLFGLGARCGTEHAQHVVSDLNITNAS